ncbi:MAG: DUF1501 domain-containing protein [Blastocatellia bacterium]|nr:DUF1501 domain-containing protein [Blastocatellia bacterium]
MKSTQHPILMNRRTFLGLGGMTLASLCLGSCQLSKVKGGTPPIRPRLVVLEMNGGNDGLNTVVPFGAGAYYDLRKRIAIAPGKVQRLDSMWGLHPALPRLADRFRSNQVAVFHGVGHSSEPDLSHFAMQDVWRAGLPQGFRGENQTGWLGRLLDVIGDPQAPFGGFSLAPAVSPMLRGVHDYAGAAEYPGAGRLQFPAGLDDLLRNALHNLGMPTKADSTLMQAARQGLARSLPIADFMNNLERLDKTYPKTDTGYSLSFAARLLAKNDWIQVIHVPLPLDFDTHVEQPERQEANLSDLDAALEAFLQDLENQHLADQTVILATSEFGRRVRDNGGSGTDHGTANSLFMVGKKVKGGFYGTPPSLTRLDANDNLVATMSFQDVLATVAEGWMGAPASEVVPGGKPLPVFRA